MTQHCCLESALTVHYPDACTSLKLSPSLNVKDLTKYIQQVLMQWLDPPGTNF